MTVHHPVHGDRESPFASDRAAIRGLWARLDEPMHPSQYSFIMRLIIHFKESVSLWRNNLCDEARWWIHWTASPGTTVSREMIVFLIL